jgi:hypothetical protein
MSALIIMIGFILITLFIMAGVLGVQENHYKYLTNQQKSRDILECYEELDRFDKRFKEFDDYKKRVDALVLKNGFKL